jgi:glycerol uptake facilitator-like aquaporin
MDKIELAGEFIGTLIYAYGVTTSGSEPYAVAGCMYIAMGFTGYISLPQFNPAITLAMALRRLYHDELTLPMVLQFLGNFAIQILAVVVAALLGWATSHEVFAFYVRTGYNNSEGFFAEMVYTAVICATCLTVKRVTESLVLSAGAISAGYLVGNLAIRRITYACFNPALALGLNFVHYCKEGTKIDDLWIFIVAPFVGSIVGTAVAAIFISIEDEKDPDRTKSLEGFIRH